LKSTCNTSSFASVCGDESLRGFFGTSFFPKGMTTKTRRLKLEPVVVMSALQLRVLL